MRSSTNRVLGVDPDTGQAHPLSTPPDVVELDRSPSGRLRAVSLSAYWWSDDGGATWQRLPLDLRRGSELPELVPTASDDVHAVLVGSDGATLLPWVRVLRSADGRAWTVCPPPDGPTAYVDSPVVLPGGHSTLLQFHIHPDEDGDVLYQTPSLIADATPQQVQQAALATNFIFDFYVWVGEPVWDATTNSPLRLSALEFDFNDASPGEPGFDYNFSSQCLMHDAQHGGPVWQIWGQKGDSSNWVDSGITCDPATTFAPDMWHHIAWTYRLHPDTLQTEYVSLEIDGAMYYPPFALNPVVPLPVQAKPTLEVQFQQDARALPTPTPPAPSPSPFKEWVDEVTLTAW